MLRKCTSMPEAVNTTPEYELRNVFFTKMFNRIYEMLKTEGNLGMV